MSVILRYKEWLTISPEDSYWVYDLCDEMPEWEDGQKEYVFAKQPKRINAREAKKIIKEEDLTCLCNNSYGRIYA